MNDTPASGMRKIMNLTEAGLIPNKDMMIRIDPDVYKLMKALLFIANPDSYVDHNPHGDKALMLFDDPEFFEQTKKKLKQFGIPFESEDKSDFETCDGELMPNTNNNISPYPNNNRKYNKTKKKITPNPYKRGR